MAEVDVAPPVKEREDAERAMADLEGEGLDGLLVVMLTYGPAMRVARLLAETPLPICLANIQPVPAVTAAWDMADLTYNQGIHGAQDTANAMVRAGRAFHVVTDDWRSDVVPRRRRPVGAGGRRGHALARRSNVAVVGYAMNGMGDIRVDVHALLRTLGPQVDAIAPGELHRSAAAVSDGDVRALIADEDARFEIDPRLGRTSARTTRACSSAWSACSCRRLRRVLDPLRRDRRGRAVRAAAARGRLEPDGQGLRLRRRGRRADRGADGRRLGCSATRSSPRCTRWTSRATRS